MLEHLGEVDAAERVTKAVTAYLPSSPPIGGPSALPLRPPSPSATPLQKGSEPVPITPTEKIWLDGELVDWDKARIHVLTHSLHYGSGVFEGIRAYPTSRRRGRVPPHRPHQPAVHLGQGLHDRRALQPRRAHRGEQGRWSGSTGSTTAVTSGPSSTSATARWGSTRCPVPSAWPSRPGPGAPTSATRGWPTASGSRCRSWQRHDPNAVPTAAKGTGMYVNSSLAKVEALKAGYDEAVLLAPDGRVSECTGENIFIVRGRTHHHPADVGLGRPGRHHPGLGQDHRHRPRLRVRHRDPHPHRPLHRRRGLPVGTAAEVVPIREVDDRTVGDGRPGPGDQAHPGHLLRHRPGRGGPLQGLARTCRVT